MPNLRTIVGWVRLTGMVEGVSFLLLKGVAMPLTYMAGIPEAVKWTGWGHGILFIIYALVVLVALLAGRLSFGKSLLAGLAALVPFGPFLIDRKLAADEARELEAG